MISAHEAQQSILQYAQPLGVEEVSLGKALHRYLASRIIAPIDLPPFDNAAMDGFAIRCGDTQSASETSPVSLKVIGTIAAGDLPQEIQSGETIRIMTGAPIPTGADAVVPFEKTSFNETACFITEPMPPEANVRRVGEDSGKGDQVLETGARVSPRTIALLAALGIASIPVFKKPSVRILSTGNELIELGQSLAPGKIYNSNAQALSAAFREIGIEPVALSKTADSEETLRDILPRSLDADVLLTIGGVSAGDFDLVPKVLEALGARILFHKVAVKPGKPFLFAVWEGRLIFGLPGNPVSSLMVFDRFVRPALLKMMGALEYFRTSRQAVAVQPLKGTEGKEDYLQGVVTYEGGRYVARSAGPQGSAMLIPLARANAVLTIPADKKGIAEGEPVLFEFLSEAL